MRKFILIAVLSTLSLANYAQDFVTTTDEHNGVTGKMLLGHISDSLLKEDSSFKWFTETQHIYEPQKAVVKKLADKRGKIHFTVFMGTWCPDSRYVIPRFYKIIEASGINKNKITLTAVDRSKMDKNNEAARLKVTHVPTIIVYDQTKELGRVVEYGETGRFDEELAAIAEKAK
ncbi:TlpA family protein disulfide reductase [Niabella soli]|uniref:Thioredoxin n=1 Tax=Niabella soli DSM 19437 TaxID=929713 RepID=W0F3K3_9BACT|nr:thioredoxin family protein [Niabella soli]AHF16074.1 thioredoxin [Niabella soli DSM 19437]